MHIAQACKKSKNPLLRKMPLPSNFKAGGRSVTRQISKTRGRGRGRARGRGRGSYRGRGRGRGRHSYYENDYNYSPRYRTRGRRRRRGRRGNFSFFLSFSARKEKCFLLSPQIKIWLCAYFKIKKT